MSKSEFFNVLPPEDIGFPDYKHSHGERISTLVHRIAAEQSGSFSAEHGVGQLKVADLEAHAGEIQLAMMRQLKRTLDPKNIMNPGKVVRL